MITFRPTNGNNSRTRKITEFAAMVIRIEYAYGKRGKAHAWRWNISPSHYNMVGRRQCWKEVTSDLRD